MTEWAAGICDLAAQHTNNHSASMMHKGNVAITLWALGREGEVQRRGLQLVLKDLHQTPGVRHVDMERMGVRLKSLYWRAGPRSRWTKTYRHVDRVLEL